MDQVNEFTQTDRPMFHPDPPPLHPANHDNALVRLASDVASVATPIVAPILGWLDVINSALATVAALGGLYLLYLNILRARRLAAQDAADAKEQAT